MNRRRFLAGSGAAFAIATMPAFAAPAAETMIVHYDPGCGCCSAWVGHMREAGFAVETRATSQINRIKARLGVPPGLASCHTAEIAGYVVEGHVPAEAVTRLCGSAPMPRGQGPGHADRPQGMKYRAWRMWPTPVASRGRRPNRRRAIAAWPATDP